MTNPYALAIDTVNHIEAALPSLEGYRGPTPPDNYNDVEKVQILNYLRAVRTHIELLESAIINGTIR